MKQFKFLIEVKKLLKLTNIVWRQMTAIHVAPLRISLPARMNNGKISAIASAAKCATNANQLHQGEEELCSAE